MVSMEVERSRQWLAGKVKVRWRLCSAQWEGATDTVIIIIGEQWSISLPRQASLKKLGYLISNRQRLHYLGTVGMCQGCEICEFR